VTVCRGDDGGREPRGRWLAAAGQFGRRGQEGGADGLRGGGDLGAAVLAESRAGQGLEQGPLISAKCT
jgi:hypothetical protein